LEKYFSGKILSISEGSDLLVNPWRFSGWKDIEQKVNYSSNQLIFVSTNQKKAVEAKLNLKKGIVIHNGFNTDYFWFSFPNVKKSNDKTIKLITIGNLWDIKGHDLLLRALQLLGKQYHLTIIGEGEQKNEYVDFVRKNELKDQVSFITKQPNNKLKDFLEVADIYCQASRSEAFGIAPLEAMGCGLPVVASNVGGLPEIIIDDFNGFLFESENVEDLANKIGFAVDKDWDKKAIADFAKDNFSWEKWAKQIIALSNKQLQ
jgi:glycosyltransferase involved in cell wall biosynthesis